MAPMLCWLQNTGTGRRGIGSVASLVECSRYVIPPFANCCVLLHRSTIVRSWKGVQCVTIRAACA
eukprot:7383100-Prymnesium_polylepis.1